MKSPSLLAVATTLALLSPKQSNAAQVDPNFTAQVNGTVHAISVDAAGNILVGGEFTEVNSAPHLNLAKLNPDGAVDTAFTAATDGAVLTMTSTEEGAVLIGGAFNHPATHLFRLLPNGDVGFLPEGTSTSSRVDCLAVGVDGSIAIGGPFRRLNDTTATYTARLGASGAIDGNFNSSLLASTSLEAGADAIAIQPDGKVIIGGNFNTADGFATLVRLNADGSVDTSFDGNSGQMLYPKAILVLDDGRILVAGTANSDGEGFVRRLNADGAVDETYIETTFDRSVEIIALDPQGGLLVGGSFPGGLARLNEDGTRDASWDTSVDGVVKTIALHDPNAVIVGGAFSEVNGRSHPGLARILLNDQPLSAKYVNGRFSARLQGEAGISYNIEASTDLKGWTSIGTVVATEAGIEINEPTSASNPVHFFRARRAN